jgi:dTDP-glucose 4,6-dehydratase
MSPRGVYDEANRFGKVMTMTHHRYHGVYARIVRSFKNTFGPHMRLNDGRVV